MDVLAVLHIRRAVDGIRQISAEAGGGDEQHHAQEKRHDRAAITAAIALEVFGRHGTLEAKELFGQAARAHLLRLELHIRCLADGVDRRDTDRPPRRDRSGDESRYKAHDRRDQERKRVQYQPHLRGRSGEQHTGECVAQAVERDADAGAAHDQTSGNTDSREHQRLIQNARTDLLFRRTDALQNAELPRTLTHGDGEGIVDQRD